MYNTDIKINDGHKLAILNYIKLKFCRASSLKPYILFYSNDLAIWHCFQDITHNNVNNGCKSAKFPRHLSLKPHILFYSNGLAILHGLLVIRHNKVNNGQ